MHFSQEFYQAVLDNMSHGLAFFSIIADSAPEDKAKSAELIMASPAFLELIGLDKEEIKGRMLSELFPELLAADFAESLIEIIQGDAKVKRLDYHALESGKRLLLALFSPQQAILGVALHDITERIKMKEELQEKNRQLCELNKILQVQATTDSLTGLYNHRQILEKLQLEIARANRYRQDLTIMMLDIDHFKNINDEFGHQVGDVVLVGAAQLIKKNLRVIDIAGRYGGEEFLIIMPQTNLDNALKVAERIRRNIEKKGFEANKKGITASIGIGQYRGEGMVDYIEKVDQLLYRAKSEGRNRVAF